MADDLVLKQVEIMRQLLPQTRKLLVMMNPTNSSNPLMFDLVSVSSRARSFPSTRSASARPTGRQTHSELPAHLESHRCSGGEEAKSRRRFLGAPYCGVVRLQGSYRAAEVRNLKDTTLPALAQ